jgi:hypothetical protein
VRANEANGDSCGADTLPITSPAVRDELGETARPAALAARGTQHAPTDEGVAAKADLEATAQQGISTEPPHDAQGPAAARHASCVLCLNRQRDAGPKDRRALGRCTGDAHKQRCQEEEGRTWLTGLALRARLAPD